MRVEPFRWNGSLPLNFLGAGGKGMCGAGRKTIQPDNIQLAARPHVGLAKPFDEIHDGMVDQGGG